LPRPLAGLPRWPLAIAAAAAAPLLAALAAGRTLVWRDTARLFAPLRAPIEEALRDLRLPLWNPHEALGVPLFAQLMHGVLHPVSLAGAALAPGAGLDAFIVVHVALAALGASVLARQLGASWPAAAAAGFAYGLSGYLLGMSGILQYLAAAGSAPWATAALRAEGAGMLPRLARPVPALAVAASLLAGDPQWTAVAVGLGLALALEEGGLGGAARAVRSTALGLLLAGVQLAPTWAHLLETRRQAGLSDLEREMWALAPWRLLELLAPGFFGGLPGGDAPVFARLGGPSEYPAPFVQSVFVGAMPLALAALGAGASRAGRVLGGAVVLFLWLALGTRLGADQLLRHVPLWGSFRYAEKLVGPLTLCAAVLVALGVDRVAAGLAGLPPSRPATPTSAGLRPPAFRPGSGKGLPATSGLLGVLLGGAAVAVAGGATLALMAGLRPGVPDAVVQVRLAVGLGHAAAGLGALAAAIVLLRRRPGLAARFPVVAAGLVYAQALAAAPFALHLGHREVVESRPLAALLSPAAGAGDPVPRIAVATQGLVEKAQRPWDQAEWLEAAQSRMGEPSFNVPAGLDQVMTYTGLEPRRHAALASAFRREFGPAAWAAWRRFGLSHVVVNEAGAFEPAQQERAAQATRGGEPALVDELWGFTVWKVPHRPWAFFAERVALAASEAEARRRLVELMASADDRSVVVEAAVDAAGQAGVVTGAAGALPAVLSSGRILASSRGVDRLRLEAESAGDGLLVVNDAYWPGWRATVDGRPVPIVAVDALVRGVRWPGGRHVLEMRYAPPEVPAGWLATIAGAVALLALTLGRARAVRRRAG
jgi:hypothetical protein